ncbi:hypothetical protein BACDOR_04577 [Phocaeicola dorei DSM 17855]|uniref:Uncharacterized protein n=1 Tax=Phocaeicola dorei DSM 17855 TaxID=483217 RepID=B6W4W2_9BACT|nr:hypothetical protein BACDOR_04577 [Phocaeicola dorei DSM 17855]
MHRERLVDAGGESGGGESLPFLVAPCGHGDDRNRARIAYIGVAQQFQQLETVRSGHLYIRQEQVVVRFAHLPDQRTGIPAGRAGDTVAFEHLPDDFELQRVVVDGEDTLRKTCGGIGNPHLALHRLVRQRQGERHAERAALADLAGDGNFPVQQPDQPFRDRQPQAETFGVRVGSRTLERVEDACRRFFAHADTRVFDGQQERTVLITGGEADASRPGELDGVREQVVRDLLDAVAVAADRNVRAPEIALKKKPFVVGSTGESRRDAFQQVGKPERGVVAGLLRLVETVHVQEVVQQVQDMLAQYADIGQMAVASLAVARVHRQLRATVDDAQRGAYVVGNRQDDFLAHIQQVAVLPDNLFQLALSGLPTPDVPLDDDIREGKQQNRYAQHAGEYAERDLPHVGYSFFPEVESHLCLPVQQGDKRRQFAVQLSVLPTQAVHRIVEIKGRRIPQSIYLAVQSVQVVRRRIYPYRVFLAEEARDAFFAPYLYAGLDGAGDSGRQPVGDQAVHLLPLADALHDAQQVRLFGRQQHSQRIDLFGAHETDALPTEREQ